jgi:MoaA/NifB/PqqE/SkfB family radical SAM enzyme
MYVDPSFNCNLHCPHCISENLRAKRFQRPVMKQDMFEHILEVYGPYLVRVTFALWGEPTLNRRLPEFVRKIKGHGAFAEMSTNLSVPLTDARLDDLVSAGFDEIRLSIDGATKAAYEIYRVGGSLELVLNNVRRMVAAKKRMGLRTPRLKWQFLEWPWNEHEIDEARRMATEIGVDLFYTIAGDPWRLDLEQRPRRPDDDAARIDPKLRQRMRDARAARLRNRHAVGCDFLDHTMAVNSDGSIHPCCYIVEPKDAVGHILDGAGEGGEPFNSPAVVRLRQFVKDLAEESATGPTPCAFCGLLADGHIRDHLGLGDALTILKHGTLETA